MMMLGSPVCLFLIAHLLFPAPAAGVDLTGYYFEASTAVWLFGAGATTIGTLFKPVVFSESIFDAGNIATVPTLIVCLALASTRNRRVHSVLVPALLLVIFLDIVLVTGMQR